MEEITPEQALEIYQSGPEAVVKVICELSRRVIIVEKLEKQIELLEARIKELENQLSQNSRNSSKPPSSDGLKKPMTQSLREKSTRPPGGQAGHDGHTLKMVDNPQHIEWRKVEEICECGESLKEQKVKEVARRQVFDVPQMKMEVTEYRAEIKICRHCGRVHKGTFPDEVKTCVQYGERIKSIVIYLRGYQLLPSQRTAELCQELFSCPISEGTMDTILRDGANRLEVPVEQIKEQIKAARVVNFDETGMSVNGDNHWIHVTSTKDLTHYDIHVKRGTEAINEIGILPGFRGIAVHDAWAPYFQYDQCQHSLCNAHHLRELTFIAEELQQSWAGEMIRCLLKIKQKVEEAQSAFQEHLTTSQIRLFQNRYQMILEKGYAANPLKDLSDGNRTRGRPKRGKARCLVQRLDDHRHQALAFMVDFEIPFDNNLAERDVRMAKVRQKISGTFRSLDMAKAFCRIRSFISTARKRAFNTMDAIEKIFTDPSALSKIVSV